MNTSTDIFKLEKWWVKRITLIVVALVLAGCQSQTIQSTATTTSTPTEIPVTATLVPTNTPEPTATATELVVPDNAVEIVGGGYVYVENGKLILLGADGKVSEVKDPSFDVVFNTMDDARTIFEELDPEATNVTREDFFVDGFPSYNPYRWAVDLSNWINLGEVQVVGNESLVVDGIGIACIPREFVTVKNPVAVDFPQFPSLGVALCAVNGYDDLLPVPTGAFREDGSYISMVGGARHFVAQEFASTTSKSSLDPIFFSSHTWDDDRATLANKILNFYTIYDVPSELAPTYKDDASPVLEAAVPEIVRPLRDALARFQAQGMGKLGHDYIESVDGAQTMTGELLEAADKQIDGMFFVIPSIEHGPQYLIEPAAQ